MLSWEASIDLYPFDINVALANRKIWQMLVTLFPLLSSFTRTKQTQRWLVDYVAHSEDSQGDFGVAVALSAHIILRCTCADFQKKSRTWDSLQWWQAFPLSPLQCWAANQASTLNPGGDNCETEWSYYLIRYLNNKFQFTKILQLFMFCQYL